MASPAARILSRPFSLGRLTVPNRITMSPMTRSFSPGGVPGEDVAAYYARRAAAGVGLIITEGTYVNHPSAGQDAAVPTSMGRSNSQAGAGWPTLCTPRADTSCRSCGTSAWCANRGSRRFLTRLRWDRPASP